MRVGSPSTCVEGGWLQRVYAIELYLNGEVDLFTALLLAKGYA